MIKLGEIQQKARSFGVRDQQIEKDYILSWILRGISQHEDLSKTIVFKGGTVLKKVYFEDYRFSVDLDFTLVNNEITNEQIFEWFNQTFEFALEEANIPLGIIDNNEHEDGGINFYIGYLGPLGGIGNNKRVKIDVSRSERLVFEPLSMDVIICYSDLEKHQLLCFTLREVLVEKMRSIVQRMHPRDFYDIWYLLEIHVMEIDFYRTEFEVKCKSKNLRHSDFQNKFNERLPQYKGRWQSSMNGQIKDLPDFDKVQSELQRHFKKLKL